MFLLLVIFFWWYSGHPFARITALFSNQYFNECSYNKLPYSIVIERIYKDLWLALTRYGFLLPAGFLFIKPLKSKSYKLIFYSAWILLLLSNFMTISYSAYVPMCLGYAFYVSTAHFYTFDNKRN